MHRCERLLDLPPAIVAPRRTRHHLDIVVATLPCIMHTKTQGLCTPSSIRGFLCQGADNVKHTNMPSAVCIAWTGDDTHQMQHAKNSPFWSQFTKVWTFRNPYMLANLSSVVPCPPQPMPFPPGRRIVSSRMSAFAWKVFKCGVCM